MSKMQRNWAACREFRPAIFSRLAKIGSIAALAAALVPAVAQNQPATSSTPATPVPYASVNELNGILDQLKTTSTSMQGDLEKMRIERWKTDSANKRGTQNNVDSIRRNLQSALPDVIAQVSASPEDVAASFKLYRDLDALYDVFGSVVENAGAFGSKDEFQSLSNDMNGLENARRSMGERLQKLASSKEEELTRLRAQVKTLSAAVPPPPPKKIIVDDTEPAPKKPAAKKKSTTKSNSNPPAKKTAAPANSNPSPNQ